MARRAARAAAMQMVFESILGGDGGDETLKGLIEFSPEENDQEYIDRIVKGVQDDSDSLDALISAHLTGWTLDRLAKVDLSILRVATYELRNASEPNNQSIICNEAVSLAKKYSSEKSGGFVNGVLGAIIKSLNPVQSDDE